MARYVPGWPWWQRINVFIFTVAGGWAGFYLQRKAELSHKQELRDQVPQLQLDLAAAVSQRERLEQELNRLQSIQAQKQQL